MDLGRYQALKMTVKRIDGSDYLFIEKPGFSSRKKGWTPAYHVMRRVAE